MKRLYFHRSPLSDRARPTLVFLHGFMGSIDDWAQAREELQTHFDCLFIDLPGHGQSPPTIEHLDTQPAIDAFADGVLDILDSENIERPHLVGYSMGGRVSLHLTLQKSQRIRSLILESTSPGITDQKKRAERAALDIRRANKIRSKGLLPFLDSWYRAPLFASLQDHPHFQEMLQLRKQNDPDTVATIIETMSPGRQPDHWPDLPHLSQPTLLLAGARDSRYLDITRRATSLIPRARRKVVPNAGHNTHFENPQFFVHALTEFISSLD